MESSTTYTVLFKYLFLIIGGLIAAVGILGYIFPDAVSVNHKPADFDAYSLLMMMAFGITAIGLHLYLSPKFVRVRLGGQNITFLNSSENEVVNWFEVESLTKFWFVSPPLYKLKVKNREGYYLFTTQPSFIDTGLGVIDMSSMGRHIKKKKEELGL